MNHDEIRHRIQEARHRVRDRLRKFEASPPSLSQTTLRNLFRVFAVLDEPIELEKFPTTTLDATKSLFDVNSGWYGEVDTAKMRASVVFDSSLTAPGSLVDTWSRYMLGEPTSSHWSWPKPGSALKTSDCFSPAQIQGTEIYEGYLRPQGIEYSLFTPILRTSNRTIGIFFGRAGREFSEEDRLALMLLSRYLKQCRRHCERRSISRAQQPSVDSDLSVTQVELVVVGRHDGRVRSTSSRAAEIIQRYVGQFPRCSSRLPDQLQAYVLNTAHAAGRPRSPLHFRDLEDSSDLEVFATINGDEVSLYLCHHRQLSKEMLADAIGTSPRRAEVARHLCRGATKEEIANELGISLGTVSRHVEQLYDELRDDELRDDELRVSTRVKAANELRRRVTDYLRQRGED